MIVFFPQWQGTGAWTAIADGCRTIAGQVAAARAFVPVLLDPDLAADRVDRGPVIGRKALTAQADIARPILARQANGSGAADRPAVVIGGDCSIAPVVLEARARAHSDLQVLWIDAHADLNTAETSPSGHVHGMALRLALGEGDPALVSRAPLDPASVTLVGTRIFDPGERAYVDRRGLPIVPPGPPADIAAAVTARLAPDRPVHLHIDLDSLDPEAFADVNYPAPGGLTPDALLAVIAAARARSRVVGATLTEYAPTAPGGGLPVIRRILAEGLGVPLRAT